MPPHNSDDEARLKGPRILGGMVIFLTICFAIFITGILVRALADAVRALRR